MKRYQFTLARIVVAALLVTIVWTSQVAAQGRDRRGPFGRGNGESDYRSEGTIKGIVPGYLQIVDSEGEIWVVQVATGSRGSRLVGTAELSWLTAGAGVNFTASFNKKGKAQSQVKQLNVFTPGIRRWGEDEPQYTAGIVPEGNGADRPIFSDEEKPKPTDDSALFTVTGLLRSIDKQKLTVAAGNTVVEVELAEGAVISVDIADLSATRIGDKVEVRGRKSGDKKAVASWVSVTATEKLSPNNAKPDPKKPVSTTGDKLPPLGEKLPPLGEKLPPLGEKLPPLGEKPDGAAE